MRDPSRRREMTLLRMAPETSKEPFIPAPAPRQTDRHTLKKNAWYPVKAVIACITGNHGHEVVGESSNKPSGRR